MEELVQSMFVKTNDMHLVLYVSSLVRAILALHGLLVNKIKYRDVDAVLDRDAGVVPPELASSSGAVDGAEERGGVEQKGGN